MVEFKQEGLSAVAAFFGDDAKNHDSTKESAIDFDQTSKPSHRKGKNKALGLGATPTSTEIDESPADGGLDRQSKMKLLRMVGKRGKRPHDGEESDEDLNVTRSDSDDDEGEGRTSAIREKKGSKGRPEPTETEKTKKTSKKKKKKKKEDHVEKVEENESAKDNATTEVASITKRTESSFQSDRLEDLASYKAQRVGPGGPGEAGTYTDGGKPKRTKTRSKQKNIRKDTRGHKKPPHLIPGRSEFAGRGLTPETRAYLGLPEKPKHKWTGSLHAGSATKEGAVLGLGVDDLLNDLGESAGTGQASNQVQEQRPAEKQKSKNEKVKKVKYKNLMNRNII